MSARAAWARAGLVLATVLLADQVAKQLVTSSLARGEHRSVLGAIDIVNVRNSGVAFSQLQQGGALVAVIVALAIAALLLYFIRHATRPWIWLPTGLLLGGALGNALDRIREGAVVDFIKLPYWPAFNVADASITCGVIVLVITIERSDASRSRR